MIKKLNYQRTSLKWRYQDIIWGTDFKHSYNTKSVEKLSIVFKYLIGNYRIEKWSWICAKLGVFL